MGKTRAVPANDSDSGPAVSRLETITAIGVVAVLALALGLIALSMSSTRTSQASMEYHQAGTFSYQADAQAGSAYGQQGLRTGEPILSALLDPVTARFDYRLTSDASAGVRGTARMVATVSTAGGLTRDFTVAGPTSFTGVHGTVSGPLPVSDMLAFVRQAEHAVGGADTTQTTVTLSPRVTVRGELGGHRLADHFAPQLAFDVDGTTLRLSAPIGAADPTAALHPDSTGKVGYRTTAVNTVPIPLLHPSVDVTRTAGLGFGAVCLLLALWLARPLLRAGGPEGEATRIRALYGSHLVEVRSLALRDGPVADVSGMDALGELAKRYESMIMHVTDPEAYLVWDNGMTYRYRPQVTALRPLVDQAARHA